MKLSKDHPLDISILLPFAAVVGENTFKRGKKPVTSAKSGRHMKAMHQSDVICPIHLCYEILLIYETERVIERT